MGPAIDADESDSRLRKLNHGETTRIVQGCEVDGARSRSIDPGVGRPRRSVEVTRFFGKVDLSAAGDRRTPSGRAERRWVHQLGPRGARPGDFTNAVGNHDRPR